MNQKKPPTGTNEKEPLLYNVKDQQKFLQRQANASTTSSSLLPLHHAFNSMTAFTRKTCVQSKHFFNK